MRWKVSALAIVLAGAAGCPTSQGYVGAVSGKVVDPGGTPVEGASVYVSGGNASNPVTLNEPVNGGIPQITAADGTFYIPNIAAGTYPLVATWIAPAAGGPYYGVEPVTVNGGEVSQATTLTIAPCTSPTGANPSPPPPSGTPSPTPIPSGTASPPGYVAVYQPGQETVTHSTSTNALHLSTDSASGPEKLDLQIPHASTGWRASNVPIDLATTAGGQIVVTYSVPTAAGAATYNTYRAVAGSLYLDTYDLTGASTGGTGTFDCHLDNVLFEYQGSSSLAYTIGQTTQMGGPIVTTP